MAGVVGQQNPSFNDYWVNRGRSRHFTEELPCQAIPARKKGTEWLAATLDTLEFIGLKQFQDNLRYRDLYRMCEGKMTYMQMSEMIPQLAEMDSMISQSLRDCDYPRWLKHYDIIGVVINAIVEWYMQYDDSWAVSSTDEIESNAYERMATELLTRHIKEEFNKELNIRLIQQGVNPMMEGAEEFEKLTDEQKQQYIQQIEAIKEEMTPPEIKSYMKSTFRTAAVEWGNHVLKMDRERFGMVRMDKENMIDYLIRGKCFRNMHVGYDYYKPEAWSARNTFHSMSVNVTNPEDGEYVGRIHYFTPSELVQRYGHKLTSKQVQGILGTGRRWSGARPVGTDAFTYWGEERVPFESYHEYSLMYQTQEYLGVPLGEYHSYSGDKESISPVFLPSPVSYHHYGSRQAQTLREDIRVRPDMIQVTEAYWISWRRVFYLTWMDEEGIVTQDVVTEDLIRDFLRDNNIGKLSKTIDEYEGEPEVNTYIEAWIPEVRYGVKAGTGITDLHEDIYLYGDPIDMQVKGDSNVFDLKLPVTGIIGHSLAEKIYPYQCIFNLVMNQMHNLLEKEIGVLTLFDIGFVPSEFKKGGELNDWLVNMMDVAKSVGILATDMSKSNMVQNGGMNYFNQFQRIDLTNTEQIRSRVEIAEYIYNKALSQVGLTPQALGTPVNYQTSTGVKQGVNSSMMQLQTYFDAFDDFKHRNWWVHLAIAQMCQQGGKDITMDYTGNDLTRSYLRFADPDLSLRTFNIMATTNSKRRRELEELKQMFIQNNTMGMDELGLAKIWTSDSMVSLLSAVKESREYKEAQAQQQQQNAMELQKQQQEYEALIDAREHDQKKEIEHIKGGYRLREQEIEALGRAADNNAAEKYFNWIKDVTHDEVKNSQVEKEQDLHQQEIDLKREAAALDGDRKNRQLELQFELQKEQLKQREKDRRSKEYIAEINKN
jgi:hypothetical protein